MYTNIDENHVSVGIEQNGGFGMQQGGELGELPPLTDAKNDVGFDIEEDEGFAFGGDGDLPPPPDASYESKEEMLESIRAFSRHQGYAIHVRRSDKSRITYKCNRLDFFGYY